MKFKNKALQNIVKAVRQKMVDDGTIARIEERKAKQEATAKQLGYANAQEAYNKMGKDFLHIADFSVNDKVKYKDAVYTATVEHLVIMRELTATPFATIRFEDGKRKDAYIANLIKVN